MSGMEHLTQQQIELEALCLRLEQELEQTRQERDLYHHILQQMTEGVSLRYTDGSLGYVNQEAQNIVGMNPAQLALAEPPDKGWYALHPDGRSFEVAHYPCVVAMNTAQPVYDCVAQVFVPEYGLRWVSMSSNPIFHEGEAHPYAAITTYRDITLQVQMDARLKEQETRYRDSIRAIGGIVYEFHFEPNAYTFMDTNIFDLLGYSLEEVTPRLISDITITPIMQGELKGYDVYTAAKVYRSGAVKTWECDVTYCTKTGELRYFSDTSILLCDEQGQPYGSLGILQDITARKSNELVIRESEERFRQLADNIRAGFWVFDLMQYRLIYANRICEEICGQTAEALFSHPHTYAQNLHPDDHVLMHHATRRQWEGEATETTYRMLRPDGSIRWIQDRAFPLLLPDGTPYRVVGILDDITESKALEAQLQQSQKMESIGRLAGGIAHDFNNLLTIIMGFAELIQESLPTHSNQHDYINNILLTTQRAANLTGKLLTFARKQITTPKEVDAHLLLQETVDILRPLIGEDVEVVLESHAEACIVQIEPSQLQQVLMNLAVNARDAMPQGGKFTLRTSLLHLDSSERKQYGLMERDYLRIQVEDTGTGIPPEVQAKIFEPFFTTKPEGKGTGLGLATCYGILHQYQGYIRFESVVSQGTSFFLYLPVYDTHKREDTTLPAKPLLRNSAQILLVEDEAMVRDITARVLRQQGYKVIEAKEGKGALQILNQRDTAFDLILSDVVMPLAGGVDLASHVRTLFPETPILLMSGYAGDASTIQEEIAQGTHFLSKPFSHHQLLEAVQSAIKRTPS
jgi:PAS domain S-box-containing protein